MAPKDLSTVPSKKEVMSFSFSSPAFKNGERIPVKYTCDDKDVSPPLSWSGFPEGTRSFALIMDDPDAVGAVFTHWVLFNLPGGVRELPEGLPKAGTLEGGGVHGGNDFGKVGYGGPCPPPGKPHRYRFRLYALDTELSLGVGSSKEEVLRAVEGHVLAMAELTGTYGR